MKATRHLVQFEDRDYVIHCPEAPSVSATLATGKPYELDALRDMRERSRGPLAVDVGAHVGNHAAWLALFAGLRVMAFEPDVGLFICLLQNVQDNRLGGSIVSHRIALSDRSGHVRHQGRGMWRHTKHGTATKRLDDFGCVGVGLLKIDVEGMEPFVLRGALATIKRWRPVIYAESRTGSRAIAGEYLTPLGYHVGARFGFTPLFRWDPE